MDTNERDNTVHDEKKFNIKYFFFSKVIKYWYLYVLSFIVAIGAGYYYNWYTTPVYSASCTLLIKDDKRNLYNQDLLSQVSNLDNTGGIDNEIELLQSRSMISKTLRKLETDVSYFIQGNFKRTELYKQSPIQINYDSVAFSTFEQQIRLVVIDDKNYKISYLKKNSTDEITSTYKFGEQVKNNLGKFTVEKTSNFKDKDFKNEEFEKRNFVVIIHNFDNLIDKFTKGLEIQFVSKKATVLQLTFNDPVPQKAGDFLNLLMDVYIQSGIDHKNEIATNSLNFIDDQLELITTNLRSSEQDLEEFKTEKGITDIGTEAQAFLGSVKVYDEKISEIDIQNSFLAYLEQYIVQDKQLDKISPASLGIADPLLTKLITQLSDLQNQRKSQLNSTKPDNPIIVSFDIQIQNTKEDLLENVRSIRDGLKASRRQAEIQLNRIQVK
ncbi:MAG: hypothetical protein IPP71_08580 [Bacteroidetes bacterium]|nr:hypothetical protein [Bacteroidota bacterium]